MKRMLSLWSVCAIAFAGQMALADCPTGYACLIKDVKQQETVIQQMQMNAVKQYYNPRTIEPNSKDKPKSDVEPSYKDLLPFAPRWLE